MYSPERMACSAPKHRRDVALEAPTNESVCLSSLMLSQRGSVRATVHIKMSFNVPKKTLNWTYFLNSLAMYVGV